MQTVKVFRFAVAPYILPLTSYILHLSLPSSLSNPIAICTRLWVFFISPVGEKNFSRGSADFHPHWLCPSLSRLGKSSALVCSRCSIDWQCKGTKNRDAKQAFFKFFSDLFQMLKWRTKQEQSQTNLLVWAMPCKEEFDEVKCKETRTQWRGYAVTQFHLLLSKIHKEWNSIYIILIYYNILYNINLIPQESAAMWNT